MIIPQKSKWSLHDVVLNILDNDIVVSEFKLQLHDYIHFQTNSLGNGMNPHML